MFWILEILIAEFGWPHFLILPTLRYITMSMGLITSAARGGEEDEFPCRS